MPELLRTGKEAKKQNLLHTHLRVKMKQFTIKVVGKEILTSMVLLEEKLEDAIDRFVYPYGISNEVGNCEYSVEAYGFKTAVTNMRDSLKSDSQIFCLPRYSVLESSKIS